MERLEATQNEIAAASRVGVPWGAIAVFYTTAILVAAPFNLGFADSFLRTTFPGTPLADWTFLPAGLGPALGALIARWFDTRTKKETTIAGVDVPQNVSAAILPIVVFATIGGVGFSFACVALVYALGEELGWRGYLADALGSRPAFLRYAFTALLWWPWHMRFSTTFDWLGFPLLVLASSWLLGHAANASRSVLVAAAMHASIILLTMNGRPSKALAIAGSITLAGWIAIGMIWPSSRSSNA